MRLERRCTVSGCTVTIKTSRAHRRHVHKMHGPVPDVCSQCNEPFLAAKSLEQHMGSFDHSRAKKQLHLKAEGKLSVKKSKAKTKLDYRCNVGDCQLQLQSKQEYRKHIHEMHRPLSVCPNCPKLFLAAKGLEQHIQHAHQPRQEMFRPSTNISQRLKHPPEESVSYNYVKDGMLPQSDCDLYNIGPGGLDSFIASYIQPDEDYLRNCGAAVDRLVTFLQHNAPGDLRPRRVIKGGSLGKGTAVKGKSDIDLTLMLSQYKDVRTLHRDMRSLLEQLEACIATYPGITVVGRTPHCVKLEISSNGTILSADLLPAVDVLDIESSKEDIYDKMGTEDRDIQPYYSPCIAPLQLEMVSQLPTKLKSLIRLVKYWRKEKLAVDKSVSRWPTSYVMELVVMQAWTKAKENEDFDITRGLHAVLTSLVNHCQFGVILERHLTYSRRFLPTLLQPFIMDPCNPYNDVYKSWEWNKVAKVAREWLKKPLFIGISATSKRW